MVNNSTNINKTKQSLNSDGQQFYEYQQNEQLPLTMSILLEIVLLNFLHQSLYYTLGLNTCSLHNLFFIVGTLFFMPNTIAFQIQDT
jgi:hypothetical protein